MILLLGADGYVGQAFARALRSRKDSFIPLSRSVFDYTLFELLFDYVRKTQPELVINAEEAGDGVMEWWSGGVAPDAGGRGQDGTDPVDGEGLGEDRMEMLRLNVVLPQTMARVCAMMKTPWAQLSSGSIYCGARVAENGTPRVERDLSRAALRRLFADEPEQFCGFTEADEPNSSFRAAPCSFYSGTKALAEEAICRYGEGYIWRLRLPFNHRSGPANFLTRLSSLGCVHDGINSLSHVDDCVDACLQLWERRSPFGTYNVVNPGAITIGEVVEMMQTLSRPPRGLKLLLYEGQSSSAGREPVLTGCLLDSSKLLLKGVRLREVHAAVEQSLKNWEPSSQGVSLLV